MPIYDQYGNEKILVMPPTTPERRAVIRVAVMLRADAKANGDRLRLSEAIDWAETIVRHDPSLIEG